VTSIGTAASSRKRLWLSRLKTALKKRSAGPPHRDPAEYDQALGDAVREALVARRPVDQVGGEQADDQEDEGDLRLAQLAARVDPQLGRLLAGLLKVGADRGLELPPEPVAPQLGGSSMVRRSGRSSRVSIQASRMRSRIASVSGRRSSGSTLYGSSRSSIVGTRMAKRDT
jgi:hypothetical protein